MLTAVFSVLVLCGRPLACQEASPSPKEEAKKYFDRAVLLFRAGDIEGALDNFLASYEARPHEKLKLNIGLCLYKLGRYAEAGNALNDFLLAEGQNSPKNILKETGDVLDEIKKKAGIIQVEVDGKSLVV